MVYAWPKPVNDIYPDNPAKGRNHAVTLIGYKENEYWLIFDHYENFTKKLEWGYGFGGTIKYSIELKNNNKPMINNNTLCFNATTGAFGLYLDGKMLIDKLDAVTATFIMRNNANIVGMCKTMFQEDWIKYPAYNLKGQKI